MGKDKIARRYEMDFLINFFTELIFPTILGVLVFAVIILGILGILDAIVEAQEFTVTCGNEVFVVGHDLFTDTLMETGKEIKLPETCVWVER